jgi:hypothetical protein
MISTEEDWPRRRCCLCLPQPRQNMGEWYLGRFSAHPARSKDVRHERVVLLEFVMVEVLSLRPEFHAEGRAIF